MREVDLQGAVTSLELGEILIYPTETFYGLGVDIQNPQSVEMLFQLKGREANRPVSILISSPEQCKDLVLFLEPMAERLIDHFFPGPLTLVLPVSPNLNPALHAGTGWIGVRQSSHPLAQRLIEEFGGPITTTSANPSGETSGSQLTHILDYFSHEQGINFFPGGDLPPSLGSTVVKVENNRLKLLRDGDIPFTEIKKFADEAK